MPFYEQFHYETFGKKSSPAILFLHGFLGNSDSWLEIITQLEQDYFCIAVDLPGHGRTHPKNEGQYAMSSCAEAIVEVLAANKIEKCHLVAYSMGGRLALYTALNYPDKIDKLLLESSSPGLKTVQERQERTYSDENLAEKLESVSLAQFLEDWYNQPLFETLKTDRTEFENLIKERLKNDPAGLAKSLRLMGAGVQPSLWAELPQLQCPTALIVGEQDAKFKAIANEMAARSGMFEVAVVKNAGHNVHLEQPESYLEVLKRFLT